MIKPRGGAPGPRVGADAEQALEDPDAEVVHGWGILKISFPDGLPVLVRASPEWCNLLCDRQLLAYDPGFVDLFPAETQHNIARDTDQLMLDGTFPLYGTCIRGRAMFTAGCKWIPDDYVCVSLSGIMQQGRSPKLAQARAVLPTEDPPRQLGAPMLHLDNDTMAPLPVRQRANPFTRAAITEWSEMDQTVEGWALVAQLLDLPVVARASRGWSIAVCDGEAVCTYTTGWLASVFSKANYGAFLADCVSMRQTGSFERTMLHEYNGKRWNLQCRGRWWDGKPNGMICVSLRGTRAMQASRDTRRLPTEGLVGASTGSEIAWVAAHAESPDPDLDRVAQDASEQGVRDERRRRTLERQRAVEQALWEHRDRRGAVTAAGPSVGEAWQHQEHSANGGEKEAIWRQWQREDVEAEAAAISEATTQAAEAEAAAARRREAKKARKKAARANKQAAQQPQRYPHVPPPAARDDGVAGIARLLGGADLK